MIDHKEVEQLEKIKHLRDRQHRLLRAWVDEADSNARFAILSELREVERKIEEVARRERLPEHPVPTYVIQSAQ